MRFVLAVVEAGTVSGAARQLGVNHATVLRRIAAFEARHQTEIFERTAQGYAVRSDRLRVIEAAREVSRAVASVDRLMSGRDAPLTGDVRITSTDSLCLFILPDVVTELRKALSGLTISLICANEHLNLSRLEAQVTVRPAKRLGEALTGEIVAWMHFAVYAATPEVTTWLDLGGRLTRAQPAEWFKARTKGERLAGVADSFPVLRELAAKGAGRVLLPCFIGDGDPRIQRVETLPDQTAVPVWVACHEDLIAVPRLTAVRERLVHALSEQAGRLAGR